MFFTNSKKDPDFKPLKPVIDIREAFQKDFKDMPEIVENNIGLIEEVERSIPIEQSETDRGKSRDKNIPIRFEELSEFTGGTIVSQAMAYDKKKKRTKKFMEEEFPDLKKAFFEGALFIIKNLTVFMAFCFQKLDNYVRAMKYGGVNFDTSLDTETLFYLALSTPSSITSVSDLLKIYPTMSLRHRYLLLEIRRDKLRQFRRIFKKQ